MIRNHLFTSGLISDDDTTAQERDLRLLWLDALYIAGQRLNSHGRSVRYIAQNSRIRVTKHGALSGKGYAISRDRHKNYHIWVEPRVWTWRQAEQVEILLHAVIMTMMYENYEWKNWGAEHRDAARSLGVADTHSGEAAERWRVMVKDYAYRDGEEWHLYSEPFVLYDDRPHCVICSGSVSTGNKRKDAHDNCMVYARTVIVPRLRAAREARETSQ